MTNRFPHRPSAARATPSSRVRSVTFLALLAGIVSATFHLSSCAPAVRVTLARDGSGTATFSGALGPAAAEALSRASGMSGEAAPFDTELIRQALRKAGLVVEQVATGSGSSLFLKLAIPDVTDLPGGLISRPESGNGILVTFSRESLNGLVGLMPEDTRDALDLLMAPVFSDDRLSAAEYEEIMGAAYGKTLREELRVSSFLLSLTCPASVREASITQPGKSDVSGSVVTLSVPVSALLTLEKPVQARILW